MLRYTFLAGFLLLNATIAFSQGIMWQVEPEKSVHYYKQRFHLPEWARSFADSTLRKVGLPATTDLGSPVYSKVINLPPGVRPVDYIGRDGLPGDPLPAVMFAPRRFDFDKLRQLMIDDWKTQTPVEQTPRKQLLDEVK